MLLNEYHYLFLQSVILLLFISFVIKKCKTNIINPAILIFIANYIYNFILSVILYIFLEKDFMQYQVSFDLMLIYSFGLIASIFPIYFLCRKIDVFSIKLLSTIPSIRSSIMSNQGKKLLLFFLLFFTSLIIFFFHSINPIYIFKEGAYFRHSLQNFLSSTKIIYMINFFNEFILMFYGIIIYYLLSNKRYIQTLIILFLTTFIFSYAGSKGALLMPFYIFFIIYFNYFSEKYIIGILIMVLILLITIPLLDILRFGRGFGESFTTTLAYNLLIRIQDLINSFRLYIENKQFVDNNVQNSIIITLQQLIPRNIFPDKPYPFETQVTRLLLYNGYSNFKWKADMGGIIEFYHNFNAGLIGVFICGIYNGVLLTLYSRFIENSKRSISKFMFGLMFIGTYSAFNIGINAKMWDMLFGSVMLFAAVYFIKILIYISSKKVLCKH